MNSIPAHLFPAYCTDFYWLDTQKLDLHVLFQERLNLIERYRQEERQGLFVLYATNFSDIPIESLGIYPTHNLAMKESESFQRSCIIEAGDRNKVPINAQDAWNIACNEPTNRKFSLRVYFKLLNTEELYRKDCKTNEDKWALITKQAEEDFDDDDYEGVVEMSELAHEIFPYRPFFVRFKI